MLKNSFILSLRYEFVWDRSQQHWFLGSTDNVCSLGWLRLSLQLNDLAGSLGFLQEPLVLLNTLQEVLPALGVLDVLNADVDALGDDSAAHPLVDNHAKSVGCDVVHATGLAMVYFVWHTLLYCTITLKLNIFVKIIERTHLKVVITC